MEPLPPAIVERFAGKAMAIVGYETDSVRKTPQGDVSVPINMAYNHHHDVYLTGKHSSMQKVRYDPKDLTIPPMMRGDAEFLEIPVEHTPSPLVGINNKVPDVMALLTVNITVHSALAIG